MSQKTPHTSDSPNYGGDNRGSYSGGFISGRPEAKAFTFTTPANQMVPVLIAAPHGGRDYPENLRSAMREPDYCALRLEDRYVDALAGEIARQTDASLLVAHAPRAMLDLNRATDDVDWGMISGKPPGVPRNSQSNRRARSGLGLVPRRLPGFGEIWKTPIDTAELDARIEGIHRPYHKALGKELARLRDQWGAALLVDLHSMPPLKRQFGQDRAPGFVLGDRFGASCDSSLIAHAFRHFEAAGEMAAHNRPYAGGFVLDHHSLPARGIHAVQVEVCRSAYLDHRMEQPSAKMPAVAQLLAGLVRQLSSVTAQLSPHLGLGGDFAQAAE
ncbi:MAG: N-formylglutamate amidohydrolase [Erythrobacter sp.]